MLQEVSFFDATIHAFEDVLILHDLPRNAEIQEGT